MTKLAAVTLFMIWVVGYFGMTRAWGLEIRSWPWYFGTSLAVIALSGLYGLIEQAHEKLKKD